MVIREQAYRALRDALPAANLAAALRCSARLQQALPHPDDLPRNLVLVAFGGGKDSAYALAFVRTIQLILDRVHGRTFRIRVVTNRHAGMPRAVLENVDRAYAALRLPDDPDCELLLVDGDEVTPFDVDSPQRDHVVRRNRLDILMTGHRTFADGRPTFCNACNLSVVNSFGLAASYGDGADVFITGDSQQEQRQYALWVGRLARRLAPPRTSSQPNGVGRLLSHIDRVAQVYFTDIHGPGAAADVIEQRRVASEVPDRLRFFSIYEDTQYAAGDHLELLTGLLGFEFDDLAFSFTESDCGNPALMAHLRALKCERVFGRTYAEGMAEYVEFALGLMRKKDFPPELVELMRARYEGPGATDRMRRSADGYAYQTFGLTEQQLVCMAFSPFAGKGTGLAEFLAREHPGLADHAGAIHALLASESEPVAGEPEPAGELAAELARISGLELAQLRVLYRSSLRTPSANPAGTDVIDTVLVGDPHKAVIETRHTKDGPNTYELISGR